MQVAEATADAAEAAYDRIADQEARQRTESLEGSNGGGDRGDGSAAAVAAAASLGTSLLRGAAAGAGSSGTLDSARSSLAASGRTAVVSPSKATFPPTNPSVAVAEGPSQVRPSSTADASTIPASELPKCDPQPRLPVSEAVLYQRTYFMPVILSYVLGLAAAFIANDVTGLGQPALLYIVPSTLGAVLLTGAQRGELGRLWNFTDVPSYGLAVKDEAGGGSQALLVSKHRGEGGREGEES